MIRFFTATLLALCLVLTSLSAVVAQTRMAAAGGYCGTGAPQILLDASGLPVLDADGTAIAAPDCPSCTLTTALTPHPATTLSQTVLRPVTVLTCPPSLPLDETARAHHARAPPAVA